MIDKCGEILRWKINSCQFDFQLRIIMINEYNSLFVLPKKSQIARLASWGQRGAMSRNVSICSDKASWSRTELVRADDLAAATFLSAKPEIWKMNIGPWAMYRRKILPLKSKEIIQTCKPNSAFPSVYINQYISNGRLLYEKGMCLVLGIYSPRWYV